jgi:hypothetical protein
LKVRAEAARREHLSELLDEIEGLSEQMRDELQLDQQALDDAKSRYREEFSFLQRINPFNERRYARHRQEVAPVSTEVRRDEVLLRRCCELLEWVRSASRPVEWRTCWHGGIAGAYNEHTGKTEWREAWHTGVAGVYHPDRREIEWRQSWKHGVAGVFNPLTREIEWRESWHAGIAGVFHPTLGKVEWREKWHHGVAGIYNPIGDTIEWKEAWKRGIAGAWCPETGQVQWQEAWHHGVACVYFDGTTYRSSGSYYGDEDDD